KSTPEDVIGNPDILLMVSDEVLVFDNFSGKLSIVVHVNPAEADALNRGEARLNELVAQLHGPSPKTDPMKLEPDAATGAEHNFRSHFGRERYEAAVETIKEYALAGDIMQVVPSQRLSIPFTAAPINLYRALRCLNPSPYMY